MFTRAVTADTESVTDSSSEIRNPSSPAPSSPKPAPQEKRTDNDEMTDVKEKPLENRDIKNTTVPNSEENKAVAATPAATNYSDDEFMEGCSRKLVLIFVVKLLCALYSGQAFLVTFHSCKHYCTLHKQLHLGDFNFYT